MWNRAATRVVIPEPAPYSTPTADPNPSGAAEGLLIRWLELSELERRAFIAMARELTASSAIVERSAIDLSQRFQTLAESAKAQVTRVEAVIASAQSIHVGNEDLTLNEATGFIEEVLVKVIDTVLNVSKNAMRMVYSLDDVTVEVEAASQCVAQLQTINQQIRFLAINTAIEAARADRNGSTFNVIAREIRALAAETDDTVKTVSGRIAAIRDSVSRSHATLREIATVDMSSHIIAKERLDALLAGMVAQNADFTTILSAAAGASADLSTTIAPLIMGLQFQDRTAQLVAHVIEALGTLGEAGEALRQATHDAMPGTFAPGAVDQAWLARLVEKQTLGDVRKRFLEHLINDPLPDEAAIPAETHDTGGGDIDLF